MLESKKELEKQKLISLRQKVNIETLENEVTLLKNSQLQISNYKEISEVNLLEANLKQITVGYKQLGEVKIGDKGWILPDKYEHVDDILVILAHDMIAKFGFDINEIKIMDSEEVSNALLVSQVKPKFTGVTRDRHDKILTEVRHFEVDVQRVANNGVCIEEISSYDDMPTKYKHLTVDFTKKHKAISYADEEISNYKERLAKGLETEFLNKPLEELCKKFVKTILMPLNKQIIFVEEVKEGSLSIDEYFKNKIGVKENKIKEVKTVGAEKIIKEINEELEQVGHKTEI